MFIYEFFLSLTVLAMAPAALLAAAAAVAGVRLLGSLIGKR